MQAAEAAAAEAAAAAPADDDEEEEAAPAPPPPPPVERKRRLSKAERRALKTGQAPRVVQNCVEIKLSRRVSATAES